MKPYTKQRFDEALDRTLQKEESIEQERTRIENLIQDSRKEEWYPERLFVRTGRKIVPVMVQDILWVKAEGDYSNIFTESDSLLSSIGLGALEEKLDPEHFMRVHRSHLINLNKLQNLEGDGYGGYTATLNDGTEVKVSRSKGEKLKKVII